MSRVRVHQHVNPLAPYYQFAPAPLALERIFARPNLPLHLDVGSARGRFLLKMARSELERNFLGVEIREPLVDEANRLARENNLTNLHYEFCNASFALDELLADLPADLLETVTIQFPDPWYKKKHAKRRMVQDKLVAAIAERLRVGGKIFVQTDVDFLAEEMFAVFRKIRRLSETETDCNPFVIKTEREIAVEERNLPIYRRIFVQNEDSQLDF